MSRIGWTVRVSVPTVTDPPDTAFLPPAYIVAADAVIADDAHISSLFWESVIGVAEHDVPLPVPVADMSSADTPSISAAAIPITPDVGMEQVMVSAPPTSDSTYQVDSVTVPLIVPSGTHAVLSVSLIDIVLPIPLRQLTTTALPADRFMLVVETDVDVPSTALWFKTAPAVGGDISIKFAVTVAGALSGIVQVVAVATVQPFQDEITEPALGAAVRVMVPAEKSY